MLLCVHLLTWHFPHINHLVCSSCLKRQAHFRQWPPSPPLFNWPLPLFLSQRSVAPCNVEHTPRRRSPLRGWRRHGTRAHGDTCSHQTDKRPRALTARHLLSVFTPTLARQCFVLYHSVIDPLSWRSTLLPDSGSQLAESKALHQFLKMILIILNCCVF